MSDYCANLPPIPSELPVMVLPECNLFPMAILPLFIFEDRYRQMLNHALRHDRMFCIALRKFEDEDCDTPWEAVHEFSTVGLIRACVKHPDGTSHLMLQGIRRIRFRQWKSCKPFRIAEVDPILPPIIHPEESKHLLKELNECLFVLKKNKPECVPHQLDTLFNKIDCPDLAVDLLAFHLVHDSLSQQKLLAAEDTVERVQILNQILRASTWGC